MKTQNKNNKRLVNCIIQYKNKEFRYLTRFDYIDAFCKAWDMDYINTKAYILDTYILDTYILDKYNHSNVYLDFESSPYKQDLLLLTKEYNYDFIRILKNYIRNIKNKKYDYQKHDTVLITFLISKNNSSIMFARIPIKRVRHFLAKMLKTHYLEKNEVFSNLRRINNNKSNEIKIDLSGYTQFFTATKNKEYALEKVNNIISNIVHIASELWHNDK